ncbi:MAG: hypothetical protein F4062_06170 [Acidimicrobiia bacterium]|nr:hypothetical protein [Acidimicrobiia bacterium]
MNRREVEFNIKVLGRLLEHLGRQMYKQRDAALAELVANSWDATATRVRLAVPVTDYDPETSQIVISDDGIGMSEDQIEAEYLVVGRNRRSDCSEQSPSRKIMGRKGIGKLAGFGIANSIEVETIQGGERTSFAMRMADLKRGADELAEIPIHGVVEDVDPGLSSGTTIRLTDLKHTTPPNVDALIESLGRRFSRVVHGEMEIIVNDVLVAEPTIDFETRVPEEGWSQAVLGSHTVRYYYGFSTTVLKSNLLRGFALYANGKTAQAPPFFFGTETTASGQHGTRYLYGVIEVDYLDAGTDDDGDLISTDRQAIDWESPEVEELQEWGAALTRDALREWAARKEENAEEEVLADEHLKARIERLDEPSQKELRKAIRMIGRAEADPAKLLDFASTLISAFEYRHFHDVTSEIEAISDPEELALLLTHLTEWKVLESRAILEVVRGRLQISDKFHSMLVNDAPETAPEKGVENLHDLIADYPWLLNPEWQVLYEEKSISRQLREWGNSDIEEGQLQRYDFLALRGASELLVVEIKRAGHAVILEDLHRLQRYRDNLRLGTDIEVSMVFVSGPQWATPKEDWEEIGGLELLEWGAVRERTRNFYDQYRAVLEADIGHRDFAEMEREIARTREVVSDGAYRGTVLREQGLGSQYGEIRSDPARGE